MQDILEKSIHEQDSIHQNKVIVLLKISRNINDKKHFAKVVLCNQLSKTLKPSAYNIWYDYKF